MAESSASAGPDGSQLAGAALNRSELWPLGGLLLLQIVLAIPHFGVTMVPGYRHDYWGNANFLRRITQSLHQMDGDPRRVFGLTHLKYAEDGTPASASYYSHHGVLAPMLARGLIAVTGPSVDAVRCFALGWSLLATVLVFLLMRYETANRWLPALLTFGYILLPLKLWYVAAWKYETPTEVLILLTAFITFCGSGWRYQKVALAVSIFLLMQTDWPAYLFAGLLLVWLFWRDREGEWMRGLLPVATVASVMGGAVCLGLVYWLGFDSQEAGDIFEFRVGGGLEKTSFSAWALQQMEFLALNFSSAGTFLLFVSLLWTFLARRFLGIPAAFTGVALCLLNLFWMLLFRNHVHVHHYAQWFFAPAFPLLMAAVWSHFSVERSAMASPGWPAVVALSVCLFVALILGNYQMLRTQRAGVTFGTSDDAKSLLSMERRYLLLGSDWSGPESFWENAVMRLYLDPGFRDSRHVGQSKIDAADTVHPDRDLIVFAKIEGYVPRIESMLKQLPVRIREESPSFVFLEATHPLEVRHVDDGLVLHPVDSEPPANGKK